MDREGFEGWLRRYFDAWVSNDPVDVASLFTEDAIYWVGPFLDQVVTPLFPDGLTVIKGDGQFKGADGLTIKEDSFVLVLLFTPALIYRLRERIPVAGIVFEAVAEKRREIARDGVTKPHDRWILRLVNQFVDPVFLELVEETQVHRRSDE